MAPDTCISDSADPDSPEGVIQQATEDIAEAEEEIAEQTENKDEAESFSSTIDFIDAALSSDPDTTRKIKLRKKIKKYMRAIKKMRGEKMSSVSIKLKTCKEFDSKYLEFLDILEDFTDDDVADLRDRRDILLATALTLNNICSKDQKLEIKIKVDKKKGGIKIKIKEYKKKKDDDINKLIEKILELWEQIKEANDDLASQGKPTIPPPTTVGYTTTATEETTTSGSAAGLESTTAGSSAGLESTTGASSSSSSSAAGLESTTSSGSSGSSSSTSADTTNTSDTTVEAEATTVPTI